MVCGKYRAVTLLCTTNKILANILYIKVVPYAEEIIGETWSNFYSERNIGKMLGTEYWCTSSIYWFASNMWHCMENANM